MRTTDKQPTNLTSVHTRPVAIDAMDRVEECTRRARGLLRLLAVAAVHAGSDSIPVSTKEEAEGIDWLAMEIGVDLSDAIRQAFENHGKAAQPSSASAA